MVTMDTQRTSFLLRPEAGYQSPTAAIAPVTLSVTSLAFVAGCATTEEARAGIPARKPSIPPGSSRMIPDRGHGGRPPRACSSWQPRNGAQRGFVAQGAVAVWQYAGSLAP